jgi:hypothetical protein
LAAQAAFAIRLGGGVASAMDDEKRVADDSPSHAQRKLRLAVGRRVADHATQLERAGQRPCAERRRFTFR